MSGHNSLPSGHSITIFTILTVLLFALMPQKPPYKILMFLLMVVAGFLLAFTRVGVGRIIRLMLVGAALLGIYRALQVFLSVGNIKSGLGSTIKNTIRLLFYYF
ncbi:MAG: phosphatase PAP2 family protein [Deltaproteobacteria bacterium]|nr:phosphatase PAP2 family protein [Deltaproteobacteria bacterium]